MTAAEVQALIANLPPGRELVVLIVRSPLSEVGDGRQVSTVVSTPSTATATRSGFTCAQLQAGNTTPAATPIEIVEQLVRDHPADDLTFAHWSRTLGGAISVREIDRAAEAGALKATLRGKGRGHAARVISPRAMLTYLETREQMMESSAPKADWFFDVVRTGRGHAA